MYQHRRYVKYVLCNHRGDDDDDGYAVAVLVLLLLLPLPLLECKACAETSTYWEHMQATTDRVSKFAEKKTGKILQAVLTPGTEHISIKFPSA